MGQLIWARLTTSDWCRPFIFHNPFIVYVGVLEDQMLHPQSIVVGKWSFHAALESQKFRLSPWRHVG